MSELRRLACTFLAALLALPAWGAPQAAVPQTPTGPLSHQPADCMVSEAHPLIRATAPPGAAVSSARVYYRSSLAEEFTSIEMARLGDQWDACLPAPARRAGTITYFIAASGPGGVQERTAEFTSTVVDSAGQCAARTIAPMASCAIEVAPPPGFVVPAPAYAGGGGGLLRSKALLIAGAAAVLGIVTVVALNDEEPKSGSR